MPNLTHSRVRAGFALAACAMLAGPASGATLRIATWNLGWHVSQAELAPWIAQCGKSYAKNKQTGTWDVVAPQTPGSRIGWEIDESRPTLEGVDLAVMPPCGVYRSPSRTGIAVTPGSYAKRNEQIAKVLRDGVRADVIAFQEVSGVAAVREALGPSAADYEVCSFSGYKVQRLASPGARPSGPRSDRARTCASCPCRTCPPRTRCGQALPSRCRSPAKRSGS